MNVRDLIGPMAPAPTRVEAERIRLKHHLGRLRATIESLEITLLQSERQVPPGPEAGQQLTELSATIACAFARLDAYMRSEEDGTIPEKKS